jgi:hypothetical protein
MKMSYISMWMHRMLLHWLEHLGTAWNSFTVKPAQWLRFQIFQSSALPKFGIKIRWNPTDDLCNLFIHSQVIARACRYFLRHFDAAWQIGKARSVVEQLAAGVPENSKALRRERTTFIQLEDSSQCEWNIQIRTTAFFQNLPSNRICINPPQLKFIIS